MAYRTTILTQYSLAVRAVPAGPRPLTPGLENGRDHYLRPVNYGQVAAYVLVCLAAWILARPYIGITLDGQLYALQVLAVLHPVPLAQDVFLRYGSQNDFTLFPHLVAPVAKALDVQVASTLVTYSSALALLTAGWLLARRLTSPRLAQLSPGLLITLPGWYGAANVFRYDEMYMSARVPAEALPGKLTGPLLRRICEDRSLGYVISMEMLDGYQLRGEWPDRARFVYLYDCAQLRSEVLP